MLTAAAADGTVSSKKDEAGGCKSCCAVGVVVEPNVAFTATVFGYAGGAPAVKEPPVSK